MNEVELHRDVLERLAHQHAIVEVALEQSEPSQHQRQVAQVGAHDAVDTRVLHLDGASTAVVKAGRMHLREGSRRNRHRIELGVYRLQWSAEFTLDLFADHRKRTRRDAVVQAREGRDPFVRQHVGARCYELARLDEQAFEAQRGAVQRLRGAKILPSIQLRLVAIVDQPRPQLRALVTHVHVSREPHHIGEAPDASPEAGLGHVGGKIEAVVEVRAVHATGSLKSYAMLAILRTDRDRLSDA